MNINDGAVYRVPYPFVLEDFTAYDEDGLSTTKSWRPGVRFAAVGPEESEAVADGIGQQVLTVVSVHKPGRFPTRVFYTQEWISPNGNRFGKTKCRVTTMQAFGLRARGYRFEWALADQVTP